MKDFITAKERTTLSFKKKIARLIQRIKLSNRLFMEKKTQGGVV